VVQARRPENEGPAELYYNDKRAAQYTSNTRVMSIQSAMSTRALELLNFPEGEPKLVLDCTVLA
jgi:18S rRNA (guanine1575-N7)-methyltransferase